MLSLGNISIHSPLCRQHGPLGPFIEGPPDVIKGNGTILQGVGHSPQCEKNQKHGVWQD